MKKIEELEYRLGMLDVHVQSAQKQAGEIKAELAELKAEPKDTRTPAQREFEDYWKGKQMRWTEWRNNCAPEYFKEWLKDNQYKDIDGIYRIAHGHGFPESPDGMWYCPDEPMTAKEMELRITDKNYRELSIEKWERLKKWPMEEITLDMMGAQVCGLCWKHNDHQYCLTRNGSCLLNRTGELGCGHDSIFHDAKEAIVYNDKLAFDRAADAIIAAIRASMQPKTEPAKPAEKPWWDGYEGWVRVLVSDIDNIFMAKWFVRYDETRLCRFICSDNPYDAHPPLSGWPYAEPFYPPLRIPWRKWGTSRQWTNRQCSS